MLKKAPPEGCAHNGLAMIHQVVGGYAARCLGCQTIGPVFDTSEEAREALSRRGAREQRRVPGSP